MLVMVKFAFPVLVSVTPRDALEVFRDWLPKATLVAERLTTGPVPVPVRLTDCWLPVTSLLLSVMTKEAVRLPAAKGVNVTLNVQLLPDASVLPHVVVSAKSPELVPVNVMLLMARAAFPVLFNVTTWAVLVVPRFWLVKVRLVVVTPADGALPVPARVIVCGLPTALSIMLTEAARLPIAAGVNLTLIVQLALAANELPQVLVTVKSLEFVPVAAMLVMVKLAFPVLVRVTDCAVLVVPRFWLAKVRAPPERLTTGPLPVPVNATASGLL
jgi:hypothetical protein